MCQLSLTPGCAWRCDHIIVCVHVHVRTNATQYNSFLTFQLPCHPFLLQSPCSLSALCQVYWKSYYGINTHLNTTAHKMHPSLPNATLRRIRNIYVGLMRKLFSLSLRHTHTHTFFLSQGQVWTKLYCCKNDLNDTPSGLALRIKWSKLKSNNIVFIFFNGRKGHIYFSISWLYFCRRLHKTTTTLFRTLLV